MQNRQTIEALFRQHYRRMLLTARTLLTNEEEARDVVSDVFTELMESGKMLDSERAENYLMVSVRNKCLNNMKHQKVMERAERLMPNEITSEEYTEPPIDEVFDYIDHKLAPKTRSVMLEHYNKNRKYTEIAEDMGISRIAVYKHLSSGLRQLRAHFAWYHFVIAFILLSGVAFAIYTHTRKLSQPQNTPAVKQTRPTLEHAIVHYENATLEQILTDVAKYHKAEIHFLCDSTRQLRLFYDWHQSESLEDIARTLNTFESIHIEYRQNALYVR